MATAVKHRGGRKSTGQKLAAAAAAAAAAGARRQSRQLRAQARRATADRLVQAADASDVNPLCDSYGLRRDDLVRMTGFSLRALAGWSAGKLPSEPAKRRLHEIRRLLDALAEVVKPEAIAPWLKQRNPNFENMTPVQVIEVGEIDRLWQMVHHMGSGNAD